MSVYRHPAGRCWHAVIPLQIFSGFHTGMKRSVDSMQFHSFHNNTFKLWLLINPKIFCTFSCRLHNMCLYVLSVLPCLLCLVTSEVVSLVRATGSHLCSVSPVTEVSLFSFSSSHLQAAGSVWTEHLVAAVAPPWSQITNLADLSGHEAH